VVEIELELVRVQTIAPGLDLYERGPARLAPIDEYGAVRDRERVEVARLSPWVLPVSPIVEKSFGGRQAVSLRLAARAGSPSELTW
jgi:hypothetical protein